MDGRQMRETDRNIRAGKFFNNNHADFANIPAAVEMIGELAAKTAKVAETYQRQLESGGATKQQYVSVKDLYQHLRDEMRDIADISRTIERKTPGISELFPAMQGSGKRKLIASARVFADNAVAYEQLFIKNSMDETFIEDLRDSADALEAALNQAQGKKGERVGATDTLEEDVSEASEIVEAMRPIVKRIYRNNPQKLGEWEVARHVERHTPVPRKPKT